MNVCIYNVCLLCINYKLLTISWHGNFELFLFISYEKINYYKIDKKKDGKRRKHMTEAAGEER